MAAAVRKQMQDRALKAEKLLDSLRPCLAQLKEAAVANACKNELGTLANENERLKVQVDRLVAKLGQCEQQNGVTQVCTSTPSAAPAPCQPVVVPVTKSTQSQSTKSKNPATKENKKFKEETKAPAAASSDPVDISMLLLKVGKIVDVKKHPDADSLYIETVDLDEKAPRTILSGLVKHVPIEKMQNRLAVFACNLKPAKMRGVLSEGMIMCASTPEKIQVIDVPAGAVPGDIVSFPDYPGEPLKQLNPKKKIWESLVPDLKTNAEGIATYKGSPFTVPSKGVCHAPGCPNFPIK